MTSTSFKFPPHQAVSLADEESRLVAVVAPTFTPGVHHVGILELVEDGDKLIVGSFIAGPVLVLAKDIWRKLATMPGGDTWDCVTPHTYPPVHNFSIPAASPDCFIELLTGEPTNDPGTT